MEQRLPYDKIRLINNIRILAKAKNIRLGALEKQAGLSKGYISRLAYYNDKTPTLITIYNIAEILGVTIDKLVYPDYAAGITSIT